MSKRKARMIHLVALIALVANLFAPVFTLPVMAEDLDTGDPIVQQADEQTDAEREEAEKKAKAEADAEATRQAEEAEKQRQAEADAEATRQAEADAEATRQAEEAEKQRQAEADAEATRQAEADAEATRQAEEAEKQRQAEADAEATRQAEEAEKQRLEEEQKQKDLEQQQRLEEEQKQKDLEEQQRLEEEQKQKDLEEQRRLEEEQKQKDLEEQQRLEKEQQNKEDEDTNKDEEDEEEQLSATGTGRPVHESAAGTMSTQSGNLSIAKVANPSGVVNSGDTIVYTITVTNSGPQFFGGYSFTDTLPTGVTYSAHTVPFPGAGDTCNHVAGVITCSVIGGIYANSVETWTITVTVNNPATSCTLNNSVVGNHGPWGGVNSDGATNTVANCGTPSPLPAQSPFLGSVSGTGGWGEQFRGNDAVDCGPFYFLLTANNLTPGASYTYSVTYGWHQNSSATFTPFSIDTAKSTGFTVTSSQDTGSGFSFEIKVNEGTSNVSVVLATTIVCTDVPSNQNHLSAHGPSEVPIHVNVSSQSGYAKLPTAAITPSAAVCNPDGTKTSTIQLTDILGFTLSPDRAANPLITGNPTGNGTVVASGTDEWGNGTYTFTYTGSIKAQFWLKLADGYTYPEPGQPNNQYWLPVNPWETTREKTHTIALPNIDCDPELEFTKKVNGEDEITVAAGENITYTLTITNPSSQNVTNHVVIDELPEALRGLTVVSGPTSTDNATSCSYLAGTLTCTNVRVGGNGTNTITLELAIPADGSVCGGPYTNTATLKSAPGQSQKELGTDSAKVTIECEPELSIKKEDRTPSHQARPGGTVTFRVSVENKSDFDATAGSFSIVDTLPAGMAHLDWSWVTLTGGVDATCEQTTEGIVCSDFAVGANSIVRIEFSAVVPLDGSVCGEQVNSVHLSVSGVPGVSQFTQGGSEGPQTQDSARLIIKCDPKIKIEKSGPQNAKPGDTITYTVKVSNTGNMSLSNYEVTDVLDTSYLSFVSADGCTEAAGVVTCQVPTLTPQGEDGPTSKTFTIKVKVTHDLTAQQCKGEIKNKATVALGPVPSFAPLSGETVTHPSAESKVVKTDIKCDPKVTIKKDGPKSVKPGDTITYTITVKNEGNVTLKNIKVTDTLPSGLSYWQSSQGCSINNGTVNCTISSLEKGESTTLTIKAKVNGDPTRQDCEKDFKNKASVTNHNHWVKNQNSVDSKQVVTEFKCDWTSKITKSVDKTKAQPADTLTYTITVKNEGNVTLKNIKVTDTLPSGLTFLPGPSSNECSLSGSTVTCNISSLEKGKSKTLIIKVKVTEDPSKWQCDRDFLNKASITGHSFMKKNDRAIHSDTVKTEFNCKPKIEVKKTDDVKNRVAPGKTFTYTITVKNTGNIPLTNVELVDLVPTDLIVVGGDFVDGKLTINRLEKGESKVFKLQVKFDTDLSSKVCKDGVKNVVTASAKSAAGKVDDSANRTTKPDCKTTYKFEKKALDLTVKPGEVIGYTITLRNTGNIDLTSASIVDELATLPSGEWTITASDGLTCNEVGAGGTLSCELDGSLAPKASVSVTITAEVPENLTLPNEEWCKPWPNKATAKPTFSTGKWFRASDSAKVQVNCTGLDIEKSVDLELVEPGGTLTYEITVHNLGNTTVRDIVVTDELDPRLTVISATLNGTDCAVTGSDVECIIGQLNAGTSATITIVVTVIDTPNVEQCDTTIANVASIIDFKRRGQDNTPQPQLLAASVELPQSLPIDSNEVYTDINCQPNLDLEKSGPADAVQPGDDIVFTITASNTGTYPVTDETIVDSLPAGLAGLEWTWTLSPDDTDTVCDRVDDDIVCEPVALDAYDGELVITLTATTDAENPVCGEYTNTAIMGDLEASADAVIDCAPNYEVEKTSAHTDDIEPVGVLSVGDTITYTITVTNTGNQALSGITLDDQFSGEGELTWIAPDGFDGVSVPDLAVGESIDLVATYEIAQADVNAGEIENCALMTYQVDDETSIERDDCADDPIQQGPGVDLVKTGTTSEGEDVLVLGNTITYTFTVRNTGNITINNLVIDDPMEGVEFTDGNTIETLAPGESVELTAEYSVAQLDVNTGMIVNCADITGIAADGTEVTDNNCDTKLVDQELDLLVAQECPGPVEGFLPEVGQEVTFQITVTNTGTVTVHDVVVTLSRDGTFNQPFSTTFEPGQTETREWTIVATQEDYEAREITIEVAVAGDTENGASAMLASMASMQVAGDEVEGTLVFSCPMGDLPNPDPDPETPVTPKPQPKPDKPAKEAKTKIVAKLPNTGSGHGASTASVLLAAAMVSMVAFGASAVGVRRYSRR